MKKLLISGMFLTSCTPQEAYIAEEVMHECSVAEQAIEDDLMGAGAPEFNRPRIDDRTAPVIKKPIHDNYTRPNGRKNKQI